MFTVTHHDDIAVWPCYINRSLPNYPPSAYELPMTFTKVPFAPGDHLLDLLWVIAVKGQDRLPVLGCVVAQHGYSVGSMRCPTSLCLRTRLHQFLARTAALITIEMVRHTNHTTNPTTIGMAMNARAKMFSMTLRAVPRQHCQGAIKIT